MLVSTTAILRASMPSMKNREHLILALLVAISAGCSHSQAAAPFGSERAALEVTNLHDVPLEISVDGWRLGTVLPDS